MAFYRSPDMVTRFIPRYTDIGSWSWRRSSWSISSSAPSWARCRRSFSSWSLCSFRPWTVLVVPRLLVPHWL